MTRLTINVVFVGLLALLCGCETESSEGERDEVRISKPVVVDFWSGNRSEARQVYERQVLEAALEATRAEYARGRLQKRWTNTRVKKSLSLVLYVSGLPRAFPL